MLSVTIIEVKVYASNTSAKIVANTFQTWLWAVLSIIRAWGAKYFTEILYNPLEYIFQLNRELGKMIRTLTAFQCIIVPFQISTPFASLELWTFKLVRTTVLNYFFLIKNLSQNFDLFTIVLSFMHAIFISANRNLKIVPMKLQCSKH